MNDPTEEEFAAMEAALPAMGEFLDSLDGGKGKTDLAVLTEDECMQMIECIITTYQNALAANVAARNAAQEAAA